MKKDKKYLLKLEEELEKQNISNKTNIVLKYQKIIEERLNNKEKISHILDDLGTPEEVIKNELSNKESKFKKFIYNITKDIDGKDILNKIKKSFKKKEKHKTIILENEVEEEIIDNNIIEDKIEENTNEEKIIYVEKPIVEETTNKNKIIPIILVTFISILWLWLNIVTIASCFAILDGVRIFGIPLTLFGLDLLVLLMGMLVINYYYKKIISHKIKFISLFIILIIISLGVSLSIYEILKIDKSSDPSEKYSMNTKVDSYDIITDEKRKMYIIFNSEYDTQYIVNYDDNLDGKVRIEVNYYEGYYDYYEKKSSNSIYISLRKDYRDIISTYISDIKDKKIYSSDELSRYVVKITVSRNDYKRLVIEN